MALAVCDYEPVSLRFFRLADDGSPYYYTASDIARLDRATAARKARRWVDPAGNPAPGPDREPHR